MNLLAPTNVPLFPVVVSVYFYVYKISWYGWYIQINKYCIKSSNNFTL
jgi:hypothetical protein